MILKTDLCMAGQVDVLFWKKLSSLAPAWISCRAIVVRTRSLLLQKLIDGSVHIEIDLSHPDQLSDNELLEQANSLELKLLSGESKKNLLWVKSKKTQ